MTNRERCLSALIIVLTLALTSVLAWRWGPGRTSQPVVVGDPAATPEAQQETDGPPKVRALRPPSGTPGYRAFELVEEFLKAQPPRWKNDSEKIERIEKELAALGPDAAPLLVEAVGSPTAFLADDSVDDFAFMSAVSRAIARMGPSGVPHLMELLRSGDWHTESAVFNSLTELGPAAELVVPVLAKSTGASLTERARAVSVLAEIGPPARGAGPFLLTVLRDRSGMVRRQAFRALARLGPEGRYAVPTLVRYLEDIDPLTRCYAARALVCIDRKTALAAATPVLVAVLDDEQTLVLYRAMAAEALGRLRPEGTSAVAALVRALTVEIEGTTGLEAAQLRCSAAWALGRMGRTDIGVRSALERARADSFKAVRRAATEALEELGHGDGRGTLELE